MKNAVYAGIIVVCLLLAGIIFLVTRGGDSGGVETIGADETQWVKCLNKECGAAYEMNKREFIQQLEEATRANPLANIVTVPCQKCEQKYAVKAVKCPKCGEVFRYGAVPNDHPDRCPKCKHSETEAMREARRSGRTQ